MPVEDVQQIGKYHPDLSGNVGGSTATGGTGQSAVGSGWQR